MRGAWRAWILAIGLSLVAHGALFATMISEETLDGERSAGAPAASWGVTMNSLSEQMEPVTPTDGAEEPETEPEEVVETQDTAKPVEMVETAEQQKPTVAKEVPSETPVDVPVTTPVETPEPDAAEAVVSPLVDASQAVVSEVKPEEVEAETEVETLSATDPPPPPRQKEKKQVQRRTSGGPVGQASGNEGRRANTAGRANLASYSSRVQAHLRRYKRSPRGAIRSTVTIRVRFVIQASGRVSSVRLVRSSGSSALDREALAMVRRASPFPPIPAKVGLSSKTYIMPLRFAR